MTQIASAFAPEPAAAPSPSPVSHRAMRASRGVIPCLMMLSLGACAGAPGGGFGARQPAEPVPQIVAVDPDLPTTDEGRFVGFTVASLGDGTIPGLWLETPLVRTETPGRVVAESGRQAFVMLRPSGGARNSGSRMSLQAFQELGIAFGALPTLTVIADG